MATLMDSYEHQYAGLSADITAKISRIPNLSGDSKGSAVTDVEKLLEELKELLEQMELEVRSLPVETRPKYLTRLRSYQKEKSNLENDFRRSRVALSEELMRRELLEGDDYSHLEDQRSRLLDNSENVERMGRNMGRSYQVCIETEQIGAQIMTDLHSQKEQIHRSRDRLRESDAILGKSSRVLSGMAKRIVQNRVVVIAAVFVVAIVIIVSIYIGVTRRG